MSRDALPSKQVLLALINQLQDAAFAVKQGYFVFVNQPCIELFGYSEQEMLTRPIFDFVHPDDRELVKQRYNSRLEGNDVVNEYEFGILTKSGQVRDIHMRVALTVDDDGASVSIGSLRDISETNWVKRELARSQADMESILSSLPDVFYRTDMNGVITLMSPSVVDALGYMPGEMIGRSMAEFYRSAEDRDKVVQALVEGKGQAKQVEAWLKHKDGSLVWVSTSARIRLDEEGQPICVEGIARNRTDAKELEQRLIDLAKYDELTQVLNRRAFMETAVREIHVARRYHHPLSLVMLDLDKFKLVNDSFGHHVGDDALRYFADCCKQVLRKTDIVSRMGGEEFAVLMPQTQISDAAEVMERLGQQLKDQPLAVESELLTLTFSAGLVALTDTDGSPEALLKRADRLLYQAKENGRDQIINEG